MKTWHMFCSGVEEVLCEIVMETHFLWSVLVLPVKIKMPDRMACNLFPKHPIVIQFLNRPTLCFLFCDMFLLYTCLSIFVNSQESLQFDWMAKSSG